MAIYCYTILPRKGFTFAEGFTRVFETLTTRASKYTMYTHEVYFSDSEVSFG
jgi:hypothetical protein